MKKKQFVVLLQIGKWNAIICAPVALFVFILVYSECIFYSPIPNVSSPEEMPEFNRMKKQTFSRWLAKKTSPRFTNDKKIAFVKMRDTVQMFEIWIGKNSQMRKLSANTKRKRTFTFSHLPNYTRTDNGRRERERRKKMHTQKTCKHKIIFKLKFTIKRLNMESSPMELS